jgi:hypothetical protein
LLIRARKIDSRSGVCSFPPLNDQKQGGTTISPFGFGVLRSACSTNPMSLSPGREQRWPRRGGLLRKENGMRNVPGWP